MAAGDMYILRVNGKVIKAFQSVGAPIAKVKEYMKQNNIQGVGELTNNRTNGKFIVTAKDSILDEAIKSTDAGRGYSQSIREAKGLLTRAQNITTQYNRLMADIKELRSAVGSDASLETSQTKEILDVLNQAYSYIGNHTEIH